MSFLQGCRCYLVGFSSGMRNVAEGRIKKAGGSVAPPIRKLPAMFSKQPAATAAATLPPGVTHVLCGSGRDYQHTDPRRILEEVGVPSLPDGPKVKVVLGEWLSQCLLQGQKLEEGPYLIDMTAKPPPPPPAVPSPPPALKRGPDDAGGSGSGSARGGSPGAKRPRPASSGSGGDDGDDGAAVAPPPPPPPPLLAGRPPQPVPGLSRAVPTNHVWVKYAAPLELLHLKVNGGHALGQGQGNGPPVRIAAFDLDSTLVKVRSGKKFPQHAGDWEWLYPGQSVPQRLQELHAQGYHLYIISNQKGISSTRVKLSYAELTERASRVVAALGLPEGAPVDAYCATHDNVFSKPRPGMWYLLEDKYGGPANIDRAASVYVGDAAGRPAAAAAGWPRKDFSDSDLKFAMNAGLPFQTPEEFFLHKTRQGSLADFHSGAALAAAARGKGRPIDGYVLAGSAASLASASSASAAQEQQQQQEAVILVGPPASGKSSYCTQRLPGYTRINQDQLRTLQKCQQAAREALQRGESLVIDATNAPRALRQEWVALLRQAHNTNTNTNTTNGPQQQLHVRAVEFLAPERAVVHLNCFRGVNPDSADPRVVPYPALKGIINRLERVQAEKEGFDRVEEVRGLAPGPFRHAREQHLFFSWLGTA